MALQRVLQDDWPRANDVLGRHRWTLSADSCLFWSSVQVWTRRRPDLFNSSVVRCARADCTAELVHEGWHHGLDPQAVREVLGLVRMHLARFDVHPTADGRVWLHRTVRHGCLARGEMVGCWDLFRNAIHDDCLG